MPRTDPDPLDDALERHGTAVWRLIVRVLGDDGHDAADCYQQAFADLAARHRRGDVRDAGALLKRMAAARAVDAVRRRVRDRGRSHALDPASVPSVPGLGPGDSAEADELLADLRAALAGLPEAQATAFVLTRIESVPHDEAARALGVTGGHLRVLLHRARASLSGRLESHRPFRESRP